jgi:hypothetical protein
MDTNVIAALLWSEPVTWVMMCIVLGLILYIATRLP